ncbi:MAG TPA: hypothetical protein VMB78_07495 [Dissulfurispiraceae bacterium]|nr:hypothetical protein [Dissulfurispiraceae bacterium]
MKINMSPTTWLFLAFFALLFQPKLALFDCSLNLTIVLVYAFGIKTAPPQPAASGSGDVAPEIASTAFGACIGLIEDVMTGLIIGPNLLSKGLAGLASSIMYREIFFGWGSVSGGVVLAVLTLMDGLIVLAARQLFSNTIMSGSIAANVVIMQAIMNIPFGLILRPGQNTRTTKWFYGKRYI